MNKALFLDRDGVILQGIYDNGHIRTALKPKEISYIPGIFELTKTAIQKRYLVIIISNQPGIGLQQLSTETFNAISEKILSDFKMENAPIDDSFYCFHHPFAKLKEYQKECDCRKPKPGLLLQAAKKYQIDMKNSWFIGDGVTDVKAGVKAGCKTILMGHIYETEYLRLVEKHLEGIKPNAMVKTLKEIIPILS